jgi:iron complex outermembrane recepter protein
MAARIFHWTGGLALGVMATPAFAQETPLGGGAADRSDDIIVTARRRSENLQDVPLAVSVISDERLAATGSNNVLRLTQIQPSLQFYSSNDY